MTADTVRMVVDTILKTAEPKRLDTEFPVAAVPNGLSLVSLEPYQAARNRFRGTYETSLISDFGSYSVMRCSDDLSLAPQTFVDVSRLRAVTFFNMTGAGHCDDRAALSMERTAAYEAYLSLSTRSFTQRQMVEFLDSWLHCLHPMHGEDGSASAMTMAAAIAAIRRIDIKAESSSVNQVHDMGGRRSTLESVEASSAAQMPTHFLMRFKPAEELDDQVVHLHLSVRSDSEGKPALSLRSRSHGVVLENIAADFERRVRSELGQGARVFRGSFNP